VIKNNSRGDDEDDDDDEAKKADEVIRKVLKWFVRTYFITT
jgi:hypothetical protein